MWENRAIINAFETMASTTDQLSHFSLIVIEVRRLVIRTRLRPVPITSLGPKTHCGPCDNYYMLMTTLPPKNEKDGAAQKDLFSMGANPGGEVDSVFWSAILSSFVFYISLLEDH